MRPIPLLLALCYAWAKDTEKPGSSLRGYDTTTKPVDEKSVAASSSPPSQKDATAKEPPKEYDKNTPSSKPARPASPKAGPDIVPPQLDLGAPDVDDPSRALTCAKLGDDTAWRTEGRGSSGNGDDCAWVAEDPLGEDSGLSARCKVYDDTRTYPSGIGAPWDVAFAYHRCPASCEICGRTCDDSPKWSTHAWGLPGEVGGCAWVSSQPQERCKQIGRMPLDGVDFGSGWRVVWAFTACRLACGTCDREMERQCLGDWCGLPGLCADLPLWGADELGLDCAWVAAVPRERCATRDGAGVPAWIGCKQTCGTCATACEDEAGWHTAEPLDENCAWAGRNREQRCDVAGADGTLAYESCRFSCGSCDRNREKRCLDENIGCLERNGLNYYGRPEWWA